MANTSRLIELSDGSIWKPQGGSSRNFVNVSTGQTLSRRQFDKRSGRLGSTSYEAKAKASPPQLRQQRPARGRKRRQQEHFDRDLAHLNPYAGKRSRGIEVPFTAYRTADYVYFIDQTFPYQPYYDEAVYFLSLNKKILAIQITLTVQTKSDEVRHLTLLRPYPPEELPPFGDVVKTAFDMTYEGDQCLSLQFRIRFRDIFIKPSKRPKRKQLKTKRS